MKSFRNNTKKFKLSYREFFTISLAITAILIPLNLQLKSNLDERMYKNEREVRYHNSLEKEINYNLRSMVHYMAGLSRGENDMKYIVQNDIYLAGISSGDILIVGENRGVYDDLYLVLQKIEDVGRIDNNKLTLERLNEIFKEAGTDFKSISEGWNFDQKVYDDRENKLRADSNIFMFWIYVSNISFIVLAILTFNFLRNWKNINTSRIELRD